MLKVTYQSSPNFISYTYIQGMIFLQLLNGRSRGIYEWKQKYFFFFFFFNQQKVSYISDSGIVINNYDCLHTLFINKSVFLFASVIVL